MKQVFKKKQITFWSSPITSCLCAWYASRSSKKDIMQDRLTLRYALTGVALIVLFSSSAQVECGILNRKVVSTASTDCNGHGTLIFNYCVCYSGFIGSQCEVYQSKNNNDHQIYNGRDKIIVAISSSLSKNNAEDLHEIRLKRQVTNESNGSDSYGYDNTEYGAYYPGDFYDTYDNYTIDAFTESQTTMTYGDDSTTQESLITTAEARPLDETTMLPMDTSTKIEPDVILDVTTATEMLSLDKATDAEVPATEESMTPTSEALPFDETTKFEMDETTMPPMDTSTKTEPAAILDVTTATEMLSVEKVTAADELATQESMTPTAEALLMDETTKIEIDETSTPPMDTSTKSESAVILDTITATEMLSVDKTTDAEIPATQESMTPTAETLPLDETTKIEMDASTPPMDISAKSESAVILDVTTATEMLSVEKVTAADELATQESMTPTAEALPLDETTKIEIDETSTPPMDTSTKTESAVILDVTTATEMLSVEKVTAADELATQESMTATAEALLMDETTQIEMDETSTPPMDTSTKTESAVILDVTTATEMLSVEKVTAADELATQESMTATAEALLMDETTQIEKDETSTPPMDTSIKTESAVILDVTTATEMLSVEKVTAADELATQESMTATAEALLMDETTQIEMDETSTPPMDTSTKTESAVILDVTTATEMLSVEKVTAADELATQESMTATAEALLMDETTQIEMDETSTPPMDTSTKTESAVILDVTTATEMLSVESITAADELATQESMTATAEALLMDETTQIEMDETSTPPMDTSTKSESAVILDVTTATETLSVEKVTAADELATQESMTATAEALLMDETTQIEIDETSTPPMDTSTKSESAVILDVTTATEMLSVEKVTAADELATQESMTATAEALLMDETTQIEMDETSTPPMDTSTKSESAVILDVTTATEMLSVEKVTAADELATQESMTATAEALLMDETTQIEIDETSTPPMDTSTKSESAVILDVTTATEMLSVEKVTAADELATQESMTPTAEALPFDETTKFEMDETSIPPMDTSTKTESAVILDVTTATEMLSVENITAADELATQESMTPTAEALLMDETTKIAMDETSTPPMDTSTKSESAVILDVTTATEMLSVDKTTDAEIPATQESMTPTSEALPFDETTKFEMDETSMPPMDTSTKTESTVILDVTTATEMLSVENVTAADELATQESMTPTAEALPLDETTKIEMDETSTPPMDTSTKSETAVIPDIITATETLSVDKTIDAETPATQESMTPTAEALPLDETTQIEIDETSTPPMDTSTKTESAVILDVTTATEILSVDKTTDAEEPATQESMTPTAEALPMDETTKIEMDKTPIPLMDTSIKTESAVILDVTTATEMLSVEKSSDADDLITQESMTPTAEARSSNEPTKIEMTVRSTSFIDTSTKTEPAIIPDVTTVTRMLSVYKTTGTDERTTQESLTIDQGMEETVRNTTLPNVGTPAFREDATTAVSCSENQQEKNGTCVSLKTYNAQFTMNAEYVQAYEDIKSDEALVFISSLIELLSSLFGKYGFHTFKINKLSKGSVVVDGDLVFADTDALKHTATSLGGLLETQLNATGNFSNIAVKDVDECSTAGTNDCSFHARCINIDGGFTCSCNEGFQDVSPNRPGRLCENFCDSAKCLNGGECYVDGNSTHCRCQPQFGGIHCEESIYQWRQATIAISIVLGVFFLAVLLGVICFACRKQKKSSTYQSDLPLVTGFKSTAEDAPKSYNNPLVEEERRTTARPAGAEANNGLTTSTSTFRPDEKNDDKL
ncbi:unnamed protein product [Clavelina lepadiformis]|uniref:EGF-like domain-containing protein n=1 Tax=Clavelina lepadiformis TaxID=159417 RepID=A0ABP0FSV8_CLALP